MESNDIPPENLNIIFDPGNFYSKEMKVLLRRCQQNPKHTMRSRSKRIAFGNITLERFPPDLS